MQVNDLGAKWNAHCSRSPIHAFPIFDGDRLLLGAETTLAVSRPDKAIVAKGCAQGNEARLIALLSAAYGRPVSETALAHMRRSLQKQAQGDALLASIHLALTGFGKFDQPREAAFRLFAADELMRSGVAPRDILRALDLDPALIDRIEKYSPDQPRVPAGNGRPSGQWTSEANGGATTGKPSVNQEVTRDQAVDGGSRDSPVISSTLRLPRTSQVLSDANPDPIRAGEQYAVDLEIDPLDDEDPRVKATNDALMEILQAVAAVVPTRAQPLYGIGSMWHSPTPCEQQSYQGSDMRMLSKASSQETLSDTVRMAA